MFEVELSYPTRMGNLTIRFTNSREEAEQLRRMLRAVPDLADATILIMNSKPAPTVDEAMQRFAAELQRFPVYKKQLTQSACLC